MKIQLVPALLLLLLSRASLAQTQKGADIDSPTLEVYDECGFSVSMPDDNVIAVGIPGMSEDGGVAVYTWDGEVWELKGQPVLATEEWAQTLKWGVTVSMPDADTFAASNRHSFQCGSDWPGRTVVIEWNGSAWEPKGEALSGYSMDMADSDHLGLLAWDSVSEMSVPKTFQWTGSVWQEYGVFPEGVFIENCDRGQVSMPDAQTIAVGFPEFDGTTEGKVEVYSLVGETWVQRGQTLGDEDNQLQFGWSLSMPDDNTIGIGARASASTFVYEWQDTAWVQKGNVMSEYFQYQFGYSVSMPDADHIAFGGPYSQGSNGLWQECGAVQVYKYVSEPEPWQSHWQTQNNPEIHGEGPNNLWGHDVSMPSPNVVAAGAPGNYGPDGVSLEHVGHARVFDLEWDADEPNRVNELVKGSEGNVVPNPTSGEFCLSQMPQGLVRWTDASGRILREVGPTRCFDFSESEPGVYFLQIVSPSAPAVHRVQVVK